MDATKFGSMQYLLMRAGGRLLPWHLLGQEVLGGGLLSELGNSFGNFLLGHHLRGVSSLLFFLVVLTFSAARVLHLVFFA